MTVTATPRLHAQLEAPAALDDAGVAKLTITNDGVHRDVYRLPVEAEFHQDAPANRTVSADQMPLKFTDVSSFNGWAPKSTDAG